MIRRKTKLGQKQNENKKETGTKWGPKRNRNKYETR